MRRVFLTSGKAALVDDGDYDRVSRVRWWVNRDSCNAYARGKISGRRVLMHRFILGVSDSKVKVDHINGDTLDNRKSNLRLCAHRENCHNSRVRRKRASSEFKGVRLHKLTGKWQATIGRTYLGLFNSKRSAAAAYDIAAILLYSDFARLNFPKGIPTGVEITPIVRTSSRSIGEVRKLGMPISTFPRDLPLDFVDPLLDTYSVPGPEAPESMEGRKRTRRTKRTNPLDSAK
jgi:hypothetical protein